MFRKRTMKTATGKVLTGFLVLAVLGLLFWSAREKSLPAISLLGLNRLEDELAVGKACLVRDEQGELVTMISRRVRVGDEIITAEGKHYRVTKTAGEEAVARLLGMDRDLLAYQELFSTMEIPVARLAKDERPVAIYHTHSDESYLPSDGRVSIPFQGGILQVGDSYAGRLNQEGTRVLHDKTPHDPHDDNAYYRSRRTAAQLLKKNPVAVFDVHRDGVEDPGFYRRIVSNQDVAQVRLVVGRENPRMASNLDFAKRLMAYANKVHWPIVKEIFIGQGNYNQDLLPTALLIEAGTYTNKKEEAMRGVAQLAEAVPTVLGVTAPPGGPGAGPAARQPGSWTALALILMLTIVGGGLFLVISSGGWSRARDRLRYFFGKEFANFLGPQLKRLTFRRRRVK